MSSNNYLKRVEELDMKLLQDSEIEPQEGGHAIQNK
jgi:hypothetical protein